MVAEPYILAQLLKYSLCWTVRWQKMLDLRLSTKFKKDYIRCRKRQYDMRILQSVVDVLSCPITSHK